MAIRTFRQKAMGFGSVPVNITAKINGVTVFTGDVVTDVNPPPPLPDASINLGEPIFSWTNPDIAFQGTAYMEVTVNNSITDDCFLMLTDTIANYLTSRDSNTKLVNFYGPNIFGYFYSVTVNDPQGDWVSSDPQTDVVIDGVPVEPHPLRSYPGQYYWKLLPQQTLTCSVNIQRGYDIPPAFDMNESYVQDAVVSWNSYVYAANQNTIGNLPSDSVFWRQVGVDV